jgi:hypothetical protein
MKILSMEIFITIHVKEINKVSFISSSVKNSA